MEDQLKIELAILSAVLILARIFYLVHKITTGFSREASNKRVAPCRTIICIGSGGHTTEMLTLMTNLDFTKYCPRYYIMAKTDKTSYMKVKTFEEAKNQNNYKIIEIPRSRVVGQSYITSVFTTLYSIFYSIPLVFKLKPDLILCNGPGTCIPICLLSFLLKAAFIFNARIVFIESFCRTETFSLTGKILMYFADNFLVQWSSLKQKLKRAEYIGQLM
ncbi:UDP-N-acetylglucosamine transferase subunit ALG14 homolog [Tribolium madens]|uniref:UDP-N-acetylglucosamine transferase subunit ALG14 homolog n=1 Tax=Tribolium madens TaxID=41895 RepID=UPI001CF74466|nr:UDP-N-acetylglucosamine transferase subunit ALG14 homolog [Tribolium madens]XP_044270452.1 UDP-N-acetylglucosamine transferase subunit ALG14 homolog [Tribolium madens]